MRPDVRSLTLIPVLAALLAGCIAVVHDRDGDQWHDEDLVEERMEVTERLVGNLEQRLDRLRAQRDAGRVADLDVLEAERELLEARLRLLELRMSPHR